MLAAALADDGAAVLGDNGPAGHTERQDGKDARRQQLQERSHDFTSG
jgi:hypothetical protein